MTVKKTTIKHTKGLIQAVFKYGTIFVQNINVRSIVLMWPEKNKARLKAKFFSSVLRSIKIDNAEVYFTRLTVSGKETARVRVIVKMDISTYVLPFWETADRYLRK